MSLDIKSLLANVTPEEVTQLLEGIAEYALPALGQPELVALVPVVGALAQKIEQAVSQPSPSTILGAEVQGADDAVDEAERAKLTGKP